MLIYYQQCTSIGISAYFLSTFFHFSCACARLSFFPFFRFRKQVKGHRKPPFPRATRLHNLMLPKPWCLGNKCAGTAREGWPFLPPERGTVYCGPKVSPEEGPCCLEQDRRPLVNGAVFIKSKCTLVVLPACPSEASAQG